MCPRILLLLFDQSNKQIWSLHYDHAEACSELELYERQGYTLAAKLSIKLTEAQNRAMSEE